MSDSPTPLTPRQLAERAVSESETNLLGLIARLAARKIGLDIARSDRGAPHNVSVAAHDYRSAESEVQQATDKLVNAHAQVIKARAEERMAAEAGP